MPKPLFIYLLSDPRDGKPRYVGKTDRSIKQRYKEHRDEIKGLIYGDVSNPAKVRWLHDLKTLGMEPIVEEIDYDDFENQIKEDYWICFYLNSGCEILNMIIPANRNIPYPAPGAEIPTRIKRTVVQLRSKDSHVYKESRFDQGKTEYLSKIYILIDPLTLQEKFIGATDLDLDDEYNRLRSEMYSRDRSIFGEWWHTLFQDHDERPIMKQIEQIKYSETLSTLEYFVKFYSDRKIHIDILGAFNSSGKIKYTKDKINDGEECLAKTILRKGEFGITPRELSRTSAGKHPAKIIDAMVSSLISKGIIYFQCIPTPGRPRDAWVHADFPFDPKRKKPK